MLCIWELCKTCLNLSYTLAPLCMCTALGIVYTTVHIDIIQSTSMSNALLKDQRIFPFCILLTTISTWYESAEFKLRNVVQCCSRVYLYSVSQKRCYTYNMICALKMVRYCNIFSFFPKLHFLDFRIVPFLLCILTVHLRIKLTIHFDHNRVLGWCWNIIISSFTCQ